MRFILGMHVWDKIFNQNDKIYIAEMHEQGVKDARSMGFLPASINAVIGDQGDPAVVERWIEETGGNFDFIIDDGGHLNYQILTSFNILWGKALKPGGIYFIEDLQVTRRRYTDGNDHDPRVPDVIKDWIEQLMLPRHLTKESLPIWKHKIPSGVKWISCQNHMCAIAKCKEKDIARCTT